MSLSLLTIYSSSDSLITFHRYARAERDLKQARPYGEGAKSFYDVAEIQPDKEDKKELYIAMTSDRGKLNSLLVVDW